MKRLIFPLLILFTMGFTCPITGLGLGSQVDDLLPDPLIGLDTLENYQAVLTITFLGTEDGLALETIDSYIQSEWPSLEAQFTIIETSGEYDQPLFQLVGDVGEAHYFQDGSASLCEVRWGPLASDSSPLRLGLLLYPVGTARSAGQETVEGISTRRYTIDAASMDFPDDVEVNGEVWIAEQGGYLVKYSLQVTGSGSYFGEGKQGTQQVEYLLSEVNTHPEVVYPQGCLPVLSEFPTMEDATEIIRLPGLLDFLSKSDLETIAAFYQDQFESRGWEVAIDLSLDGEQALLVYTRTDSKEVAFLSIDPQDRGAWVTISFLDPEKDATSTPGPPLEPDFSSDPVMRVTSGLSILLGMDTDHPGLPSYHMESYHKIPTWVGGGVIEYEDWMVADVEGKNLHFKDRVTAPGGLITISEAYLMGEEEYDVESGVVQPEGASMTKLAWVLWPLDPVVILGTGAAGAQAAGTEMLDERLAEIYTIDATGTLGAVAGASLSVTAVSGTVWIDQETGALLKAELDYTADVKDDDGNVKGSGSGRLEIVVTQVGRVTVTLPVR